MKTTNEKISEYFNNSPIVAIDDYELQGAIKWFGARQVMQSPTIWIFETEYKGESIRYVKCKESNQWFKKA